MPNFYTNVDIANMALTQVGQSIPISDLDDDTPEAILAKRFFDISRKAALEKHDWAFARKMVALQRSDLDKVDGWAYAYIMPVDCITPREIYNPLEDTDRKVIPFKVEASLDGNRLLILTNQLDAKLTYTFDQAQPHMFSNTFVLAFVHTLAGYVGYALDKKADERRVNFELSQFAIDKAENIDSANNEDHGTFPEMPSWLVARGYSPMGGIA